MATSDEDIQAEREHVEELRQQVADVEAERLALQSEASRAIELANLKAESARLEVQLAASQAELDRTKDNVESGAEVGSGPLAAAQAAMQLAEDQQKATEAAAQGEVYKTPEQADEERRAAEAAAAGEPTDEDNEGVNR